MGLLTDEARAWAEEPFSDYVTEVVSPARQKKEKAPGVFEKVVTATAKDGRLRSLAVLAHDTSDDDVAAVRADRDRMEAFALSKKSMRGQVAARIEATLDENVTSLLGLLGG